MQVLYVSQGPLVRDKERHKTGHRKVDPISVNGIFEGEEVVHSSAIISCISDPSIGSKLALYADHWEELHLICGSGILYEQVYP